MNRQEFAQSIKTKYPDYQSIPDDVLVDKMLTKYPVYQQQITDTQPAEQPMTLGGFGKNLLTNTLETAQGAEQTARPVLSTLIPGYGMAQQAGQMIGQKLQRQPVTMPDIGTSPIPQMTGEQAQQSITGIGKDLGQAITHPIKYGYEKPISQAMNVGMLAGGIRGGIKGVGKAMTSSPEKLAGEATDIWAKMTRPGKQIVKNAEVYGKKDLDDAFSLAAKDKLSIGKDAKNQMDAIDAIGKVDDNLSGIHDTLNQRLAAKPQTFDLNDIIKETEPKLKVTFKNALDLYAAKRDLRTMINAEKKLILTEQGIPEAEAVKFINEGGSPVVSAQRMNEVKSGMWSKGYNQLRPTANKTSRLIGNTIKDQISSKTGDLEIQKLNTLSGNYSTLRNILVDSHGKVVAKGQLGNYFARLTGQIIGHSTRIPVVGPIVGGMAGEALSKFLNNPERLSKIAGSKMAQAQELLAKQKPIIPPAQGSSPPPNIPPKVPPPAQPVRPVTPPELPPKPPVSPARVNEMIKGQGISPQKPAVAKEVLKTKTETPLSYAQQVLKEKIARDIRFAKNGSTGQDLQARLKGYGMRNSAIKRKLEGNPTDIEIRTTERKLNTNYKGKLVDYQGEQVEVTGRTSFGKSEIIINGNKKFVAHTELKSKPAPMQDVLDRLRKEALDELGIEQKPKQSTTNKFPHNEKGGILPDRTGKDYRIQHKITEGKTANNLSNLDEIIKEHKIKNGYLTNYDLIDLNKLKKIQGNPDVDVKIYRASPLNELNSGDWVTTSKTYANDIKKQNGGKVYEYTVKAKELIYPNNLDELPSLARFSAFKYESNPTISKFPHNEKGGILPDDLMNEARKYKTAEDFVKSQSESSLRPPKPILSEKELSGIAQTSDNAGHNLSLPEKKEVFASTINDLRKRGIKSIDAYHITNAGEDVLRKGGIRGNSLDYIGNSNGNLREKSTYVFLDPDDIKLGQNYIKTAEEGNPVVHIKIPIEELHKLNWDSNFNLTAGTYSSERFLGDIPKNWIQNIYKTKSQLTDIWNKANKSPHNEKGSIALPDKYKETINAIENRKNPYRNQEGHIKKSIGDVNAMGKKIEELMRRYKR